MVFKTQTFHNRIMLTIHLLIDHLRCLVHNNSSLHNIINTNSRIYLILLLINNSNLTNLMHISSSSKHHLIKQCKVSMHQSMSSRLINNHILLLAPTLYLNIKIPISLSSHHLYMQIPWVSLPSLRLQYSNHHSRPQWQPLSRSDSQFIQHSNNSSSLWQVIIWDFSTISNQHLTTLRTVFKLFNLRMKKLKVQFGAHFSRIVIRCLLRNSHLMDIMKNKSCSFIPT
jgi:hypothetical protein